ncbi:hypothetical protein LTR10_020125 [Elasticomyces elasticus]|uniref:Hypervirulence associated protein TUDOR domain-containing protein n=1 Tax=Exophiala sideris TaxID=1016849 RepID=A0ABR0IWE9_9EURO|nr:hypothetical protein LTR10_020125 [Elasticomyces elasticus]KAK5021586.1 hypothetical protein LTS07_010883 [Exophiala sideris]KAK5024782.1 hypothetical protein LTR13_010751 [Exophiala sideris]KAK5049723.1 hypothetical protein LTR69_010907 [Exophiala sideris]KAK5176704.1 hypothetical protein LTR44_010774 [Eurotiomycetes sp. CCFEE 6388]
MPLVVPGINSNDPGNDWMSKLMGKKLSDSSNETSFAKKDLPQNHRVVGEGDFMTQDHAPDRLNIHVDKDGTVKKVTQG